MPAFIGTAVIIFDLTAMAAYDYFIAVKVMAVYII
jgi:hypothetical protein